MGFKLGAFVGGVAKGASESIEEMEKLNTTSVNASVKSMYHNYQEYKKEVEKKKETLRGTVGALRGLKFTDGPLDDEQLIALATNPELAKDIADTLTKNPDRLVGLSKSFIKAGNVPKGQKFDDFLNDYGKKAALTSEEFATAASNKEEGFLNKMIYGNNLQKITTASRQLGVKPEELYAYGSSKGMPSYSASVEVDYAKLQKTPEFKDLKDKAMVVMYQAKQEGTDEQILAASKNMGAIKGTELMAELKEKPKESQQDIEIDYGKRILKATDPKEKARLTSELRTQQDLWANPSLKKLTDGEKIAAGNKLVGYKGIINSTVSNYLPPGTFKTNPITGDLEVSELAKSSDFAKGKKAGMEAAIAFGTDQNGRPKSKEDQLALASVGIQFDQDGKAFAPKVAFAASEAPAAPAAPLNRSGRTGRDGGPMVPKSKPAAAAPAQSAASVLEFKTEAEVEAANLPKGTKIKVGGRLAEVQ